MSDATSDVPYHLESIAGILDVVSQKLPAAADGFEEFQVRGSALRHMGVSVAGVSDQFRKA